jgi:ABC-type multidrug transport system fused ATPase/permease subunit
VRIINKILYKKFKENKTLLIFIFLTTALIAGMSVVVPWPFKVLIDNVLSAPYTDGSYEPVPLFSLFFKSRYALGVFVVFVYFFAMLVNSLLEYIQSLLTKTMIKKMTVSFAKEAFRNIESLAIGYYSKKEIGDYIYRLSHDVSALEGFWEEGVIPLVTSSLRIIMTIAIMFIINVQLTVIVLFILPILSICLFIFNKRIQQSTKKSERINSNLFSFIEEALTHLKVIQAFSQQKNESDTFNMQTEASFQSEFVIFKLDFLLTLLIDIIIAISYSAIIFYGIHEVFFGTLTTGLLIIFIFYLDNITGPVLSVIYSVTSITESYTKLKRISEFFNYRIKGVPSGPQKEMLDTSIQFEHVTLYGDNNIKILDNVSFTLEPHKFTVIFGLNGSGKTTIVNLILRFIDKIDSGRILLGGVDISEYDLDFLRSTIRYVPQEMTLFNNTIKRNIAFGNSMATFKDIKQAAKNAMAHDFIKKLPGTYNFQVGEGGIELSGGQRQRVMLARALVKDQAKISLFDEAFSALDVQTRQQVLKSIHKNLKKQTIVAISNVFDVITAADNVIIINKGEIIYQGPSEHLSKESSLYKIIVDSNLPTITELE